MDPIIFNAAGPTTSGSGVGEMLLAANFDAGALRPYVQHNKAWMTINGKAVPARNNATLLKDEWEMMDTAIIKAFQSRLTYVSGLKAAGLTYSLPDPLKHTVLTHQNMSNAQQAMISMDANVQNQGDTFEIGSDSIPIPIISSGFNLDIRQLAGARGSALPLDTTNMEFLARANAEFLENQTLFGNGNITESNKRVLNFGGDAAVRLANRFTHGGNVIDGVFTKEAAVQYALAADWLLAATTPKQMLTDVMNMKQELIEQGYSGNFKLTLPSYLEVTLDGDYKSSESSSVMSILNRMKMIGGLTIEFCDSMGRITPATTEYIRMSMVAQQPDVIRIIDGIDAMPVQWQTQGAMNTSYRILTIQVPQLRTRQAGDCGICNAQFVRSF